MASAPPTTADDPTDEDAIHLGPPLYLPRASQNLRRGSPPEDQAAYIRDHVLYHAGADSMGRAVIVFCVCHLLDPAILSPDVILAELIALLSRTLDAASSEVDEYVAVVLGAGAEHRPSTRWFYRAYRSMDRKFRKNLKQLYLVHPTAWMKVVLEFMRALVSPKFFRKVQYIPTLSALPRDAFPDLASLRIPAAVLAHNHLARENPDWAKHLPPALLDAAHWWPPLASEFTAPPDLLPTPVPLCVVLAARVMASPAGLATEGICRRAPRGSDVVRARAFLDRHHVALAGRKPKWPPPASTPSPFLPGALDTSDDEGDGLHGDAPLVADTLLARYFRELPDPVVPASAYPALRSWHAAAQPTDASVNQQPLPPWPAFRDALLIPSPKLRVAVALTAWVLRRIARAHATTRMPASNLARVWGATWIRGPDPLADAMLVADDRGPWLSLVRWWIDNWDAAWGDVIDENTVRAWLLVDTDAGADGLVERVDALEL
ncbi:hypothetical protein H9P43_008924 [Blastocladiella emersonii ATCC 22665]|nr:hypothetical protein H9P43_008924 [Blastocladiella emersonii ATCC 22665]